MPKRILVIDDYAPTATAIGRLLKLSGHDVRVALNATDALPLAITFEPEVILLDIALDGPHEGIVLAEKIREQPSLRNALLVALTGSEDMTLVRRVREAGFDRYLVKPVGLGLLESVVENKAPREASAGDLTNQARDADREPPAAR